MSIFKRPQLLVRLLLLTVWIILLLLLWQRDFFIRKIDLREASVLQEDRETDYLGVYFKEKRIGYVKSKLTPSSGEGYILSENALLHLNILGDIHPVEMWIDAKLTEKILLKEFTFRLTSPFYQTKATGFVTGRDIHLTITTANNTIKDTIRLESEPFLPISHRGYLLKQNLQKGDKIKIPYFDPVSLTGKDTIIEYNGIDKVLIHGRVHALHHFTESFVGVRINTWLNDSGKVMKEESPAGFVFLAEPEFIATDISEQGDELLSSVSVPLSGTMPAYDTLTRISYRPHLPEDVSFALNKDRQHFLKDRLTLILEKLPTVDTAVCGGQEKELAATPYIQAANAAIIDLANSITDHHTSPLERVRLLSTWVYENLEKRPVIGIPDALTTLQTRRGDCNEHASLFAALGRSIGIPTRVAAGVVFHEGAFYYHAWNEVCLGAQWFSLDTTRDQIPADLTHIKFVEGEIADMVKIGALIGELTIEVIE